MGILLGSTVVGNIESIFNDLVAFLYALLPIVAVVCIAIIAVFILRYCLMFIYAFLHRDEFK